MKGIPRPAIVAAALLALIAITWFGFGPRSHPDRWLGHVEAETMYFAAPLSGRLAQRPVERGQAVAAGTPLFLIDPEVADAQAAQAQAQVSAAEAQSADLGESRQRQAELDVSRAAEAAAQAALVRAQNDFARIAALADKGFASRTQLDAARAARDGARAQVAQTQAQVRSGELTAGRDAQIRAAAAQTEGARAALRGQRKLRADIAPVAPAAGVIEQTFYNPGEWVPANAPVLAMLPDSRRKLRFYVPQDRIAALKPGTAIGFTCDGCGDAERQARISYIAPRAEFTPPVIYSERARAKLVFMVEALLPVDARPLPPGLPVEVIPPDETR